MHRSQFLAGVAAVVGAARSRVGSAGALRLRLAALPLAHDIDPYRDAEPGADELAWLYADGLVGWSSGPVPLLAASLPEVADGGRLYRYTLRKAFWHDGRQVTSYDVAAAVRTIRATAWGMHEPYRSVRKLIVHDERHFDVALDSPQRSFTRSFFGAYGTPVLPLLRHDDDGMPIGTGPFRVVSRPDLGRWLLQRSTGSPRGTPIVDLLDVRLLSSEITAGVQLSSGEIDIALPLSPAVAATGQFSAIRRPTSTAALLLNAEGALRTPILRRAFAAAIDVPRLQRRYDVRRTDLLASLLMSGPNDVDFARALAYDPLAVAALKGPLAGRDLLVASVAASPSHGRVVAQLADTFERNGIGYRMISVPPGRYLDAAGPLRTGRFDVAIDGFAYLDDPDLAADWSCWSQPPSGANFARWCDAAFDDAVRRGDTNRALRRLYESMVCIPLSRAYEDIGIRSRVRGFATPSPGVPATYDCARWAVA
jgi:ABC-type transport system substrate-binding protein